MMWYMVLGLNTSSLTLPATRAGMGRPPFDPVVVSEGTVR